MWILSKEETDDKLILLPNKEIYSVGRLDADLLLENDMCISRTHALLHVLRSEIPKLELEDTCSKYGTFHNEGIAANKPIDKNKRVSLQDGDKIRFGVLKNIWLLKHFRIATLASSLTRPQNQQLEKAMNALGGKIVDSWSNTCTHLTMSEATITVKLIYALIEQLPVVNNNYWIALFKLAKSGMFKESLPMPEQFTPRHATDMDIGRRADRQKLFEGKTFVFIHRKHFDMYSPIVTRALGTCKDINAGIKKTFLTKDNVIVIQYAPSSQSQATETVNNITAILEQSSLRIIPEYEIGLAIIHCSIEKYCNPKYKIIQDIVPTEENTEKNLPTCTVFAENTAEEKQSKVNPNTKSEVIVPETESTNKNTCDSNHNVQTIVIDSDDDQNDLELPVNSCMPSKSITESNAEENSKQRKRKRVTRRRQVLYDTDEEDDDEVFQFNKIPKKDVEDKKEEPEMPSRRSSPRKQQQQVSSVTNDKTSTLEISTNSTSIPFKRTRNETSKERKEIAAKKIRTTTEPSACKPSTSSSLKNGIITKKDPKTPVTELATNRQPSPTSANENTTPFSESLRNQRPSSSENGISAKKSTPSRMKPLPLVYVRNISLAGFLEKSQAPAVLGSKEECVHSQSSSNNGSAPVTHKRTHISVLRESDDDEDDLFNFGDVKDSQTAKKSRMTAGVDMDNSDDELFGFKETNQTKGGHAEKTGEDRDDEDLIETEPLMPGFKSSVSSYVIIKPKPLPRKINLSGWLSCSIKTEESGGCKTEDDAVVAKKEQTTGNDDTSMTDEHTKWLNTLMNGIAVRISSLRVSSTKAPTPDEIDATTQQQNESLGKRKNFKAFVKKCNLHPQKRIIKLMPHCPNIKC